MITPQRLANQAQRRENAEYASDFYKDVFGVRPWTPDYRPLSCYRKKSTRPGALILREAWRVCCLKCG